jgi:ATP-dependent RNA helicase DDX18/HAS1
MLVCTDRASRGLDASGVTHVILFDFPRDPSEVGLYKLNSVAP